MPYCLLYGLKTEHIFCYRLYEWRITGWRWTSQSKVADFTADQSQVDKITAVLAWGGGLKGVSLFSLRTLQTTWEGGGGDPGLGFRSGQAKWSGPQNGLVPKNCPFGRYSRVLSTGPLPPPPSLFGIGGQKLLFESWQPSNADSSLYSSPFSHPSHAWLLACTI